MGCLKPTQKYIQSNKAGSRVVFSTKQSEMFLQMARESQQSGWSKRSGKLASSSPGLAVFSGPSGTGKTMAAEVIARELRVSLYRVNSRQLVSKYIGETEKNLARVLRQLRRKIGFSFLMKLTPYLGNEVRSGIVMIGMRISK